MTQRDFFKAYGREVDAVINATIFQHDGRGGKGTVPTPAPTYSNSERWQWVQSDEGLYNWARREGVKV